MGMARGQSLPVAGDGAGIAAGERAGEGRGQSGFGQIRGRALRQRQQGLRRFLFADANSCTAWAKQVTR